MNEKNALVSRSEPEWDKVTCRLDGRIVFKRSLTRTPAEHGHRDMLDINPLKKTRPNFHEWIWVTAPTHGAYTRSQLATDIALNMMDYEKLGYTKADFIQMARFHHGVWKPLPEPLRWIYGIVPVETYVHLSDTQKGRIAYCQERNPEVQTVTTIGRFLRGFSEVHLPDKKLQRISEDFSTLCGDHSKDEFLGRFHLGTTMGDFREAYYSNIDSCMQGEKIEEHELDNHPAEVYASGDFAIATVRNNSGYIKARAIVSTKNKMFWSVYPKDGNGDPDNEQAVELKRHLLSIGYDRDSDWAGGCTLLALNAEGDDTYVMPYIDKAAYVYAVTGSGGYITRFVVDESRPILKDGEYSTRKFCEATDAYDVNWKFYSDGSAEGRVVCYACEEAINSDDSCNSPDGYTFCESCFSDRFIWSDRYEDYISSEYSTFCQDIASYVDDEEATLIDHPESSYYDKYVWHDNAVETKNGYTIWSDEEVMDVHGDSYHESDVKQLVDGEWANPDHDFLKTFDTGDNAGEFFCEGHHKVVEGLAYLMSKLTGTGWIEVRNYLTYRNTVAAAYFELKDGIDMEKARYIHLDDIDMDKVDTTPSAIEAMLTESTLIYEGKKVFVL